MGWILLRCSMKNVLTDKEWEYLLQIIYRVNQCSHYEEFALLAMNQIRTLIPFQKARMARSERNDGRIFQYDPVCINPPGKDFDESIYTNGGYRSPWYEYLFYPWSSAFRYSDIRQENLWEQSELYRDVWEPQGLYYGLHCTLVHDDLPLGMFSLFRTKAAGDFSNKELYIMDQFKFHLELGLFKILISMEDTDNEKASPGPLRMSRLSNASEEYHLTKQETNIVQLIFEGKSSSEICDKLFISSATLRKHIYNIYRKTNVKSRIQLIQLFI